ncbi:MAG: hypothetical protein RLZZ450_5593 [Pseudomonadota bacterium]|jgi:hypothetical protein
MRGTCSAKWVVLLVCTLLPCFASHALAQSDHRLRWRTIATQNFRIHYHEPLGLWARALASEAEAINQRVGRALGLSLRQPVELVIADDNDLANGFAVATPYNAIRLRVASPDDMSPLADYDEWPTTLLTHEHTHVLQLEEASGFPRLLQHVFGRFYTAQGTLPAWFIEGLAVVEESRHSTGGRSRASMYEMYLRMDALERGAFGIDWIGFDGEPWPHGNLRYLYGQAFVEFIRGRFGEQGLGRFIREYGQRIVPYGLNRALKRTTGHTFTELYCEFVTALSAKALETQRAVQTDGRREGERITTHGELTRTPRFLSKHELAYGVADARHVPELRLLDLRRSRDDTKRVRRIVRTANVAQLAHIPGTRQIVYSASAFHRGVYAFNELWTSELDGSRRRRLTHALRAREPDVSPDGKRVAFTTQNAGTTHLEVADLSDVQHTRRVLVRSRRLEQVFTPRWSPDGKRIAYSAFSRGGYRDIWVLDVASGVRTRLTYDRALDRGPVFSPAGDKLYFSSDRSGIANLYAYDFASGALTQLTNVLGGAFQPEVSPDGKLLAYVGYTSVGFDLYTLPLSEVVERPAPPSYERPAPRPLAEPAPLLSTAYQPLYSLWPRYYELASEDTGNGTRLFLSTSGADPVGFHAWSIRVGEQLQDLPVNRDQSLDFGYSYRQPRFPVLFYGGLRDHVRYDFVVNERRRPYRAREGGFGIGTGFSYPMPLYNLSLRVDYTTSYLQKVEALAAPYLDPNFRPPREPPVGFDATAYWSLSFASAQRQAFDISRSWGQTLTFAGTLDDPYIGSRGRGYGLSFRAEQFVRFQVRESVLALAYTGAYRTPVALGGYPSQIAPVRDALLGTARAPGDYARLRGFPLRYGDSLQVAQLEYRFLISRINRGIETLPIFARRLHAALFVDAGDAYYGAFALDRVGVGVGAELRLDWASHYANDYTLRAGLAQGITTGGEFQWYTTLATPF